MRNRNNKGTEGRAETKENRPRITGLAPCITVLMSVYNGERYLPEAVESILKQTFSDFEFMIVEDGSTDRSWEILTEYAEQDSRIVLIRNEQNIGLTKSLNKGLALARGKYVARMDADDVAMPQRFEKQVAFLEKHPEIGILGSQCWQINTNGQKQGVSKAPANDLEIRWIYLFTSPFAHPTVMIRRDVLRKNRLKYNEALQVTQDYELWTRILECTHGANLNLPLLKYRQGQGISSRRGEMQLKNRNAISRHMIQKQMLSYPITSTQIKQIQALFFAVRQPKSALNDHVALAELYLDMLGAFMKSHQGEVGLRALQRREVCRVARVLLQPPTLARLRVVGRLVSTDLGMLGYFLHDLLSTVGWKFRKQILNPACTLLTIF